MRFVEAVEKSIRSFYNGELPEKAIEASGKPFIYDLEYFEKKADKNEK